jgi:hypothetical protein
MIAFLKITNIRMNGVVNRRSAFKKKPEQLIAAPASDLDS